MTLLLAFGVAFQLPVLLTLMARAGLITSQGLISKWRYAFVAMFAVAAVLSGSFSLARAGLSFFIVALGGIATLVVVVTWALAFPALRRSNELRGEAR